MTKGLEDYTFNESEMRILKALAKGSHSLSEIINALSIEPSLMSYNLKKLLQKGIIETIRKGSRKHVYFGDSKHALLLRELLSTYDHLDWENILTGLAIDILFQITSQSDMYLRNFSRVTFWRHVRNLRAHGIVNRDDEGYAINPRFLGLKEFIVEYQLFLISTMVKSISEDALILWQKDLECLFRVQKNAPVPQNHIFKTATSALYNLGIPLLSEYEVYFFSRNKENICVEDVILHTLLLGTNDVRNVLYSLLLMRKEWKKIDKNYLLMESQKFDLSLQINAMLQFLRTRGARKGLTLPTWEEFMAKAREYEVID